MFGDAKIEAVDPAIELKDVLIETWQANAAGRHVGGRRSLRPAIGCLAYLPYAPRGRVCRELVERIPEFVSDLSDGSFHCFWHFPRLVIP